MTNKNSISSDSPLDLWLKSDVYLENIDFWKRAWGMVKVPYTQMPDLPYLTSIVDNLRRTNSQRILDLGCGSGWLSIYLARAGFNVTGIDVSTQAIELARKWAADENLSTHFDSGDIANVPYLPHSFDAVVANSIFEHLTYELAASCMDRLRQILIPGGTFFGCFDRVGGGPGEYFELADGTHVYTDKGRKGMLLRCFSDQEIKDLLNGWSIDVFDTLESGSRIVLAHT